MDNHCTTSICQDKDRRLVLDENCTSHQPQEHQGEETYGKTCDTDNDEQQHLGQMREMDHPMFLPLTLESLQQENEALKEANHTLSVQVHQLSIENSELHIKLNEVQVQLQSTTNILEISNNQLEQQGSVLDAASQLSNYQSALTLSETQKSQLLHENHILRERCIQAGISIADILSPIVMSPPLLTGDGRVGLDLATMNGGDGGGDHGDNVDDNHTMVAVGDNSHEVILAAVAAGDEGGDDNGGDIALDEEHQVRNGHRPSHGSSHVKEGTGGTASRSQEKWESHFERLVQYKEEHGNCLVPTSTELGRWLCRQRHNFKYKNLKEDRKHRLMALDSTCLGERITDIGTDIGADGVDMNASDVVGDNSGLDDNVDMGGADIGDASIEDGGTASASDIGCDAKKVSVNMSGQRVSTMWNESPFMNAKTKYNHAYETKLHAKWNTYFRQLEAFKIKHGHCNYPTMNGSLGRWISRQRTLYRAKKLKADRFKKLFSIGFKFEDAKAVEFRGKLDQQWDDMYNKLVDHKENKGHCFDVPESVPLGKWLYRQRWLYRHGNLRKDRAEKLLAIGFEDKKVLKRTSDVEADPISGSQPYRKKRKIDDVDNAENCEQLSCQEDVDLERFNDGNEPTNSASSENDGKGTAASPCEGIASVSV